MTVQRLAVSNNTKMKKLAEDCDTMLASIKSHASLYPYSGKQLAFQGKKFAFQNSPLKLSNFENVTFNDPL